MKQTIPKLKTINEEELASFINEADPLAMGILVKSDTFNNIRKSRLKLDIEELMESKENISDEDFENSTT
ncbi:MAG: hypothetical protein HC932_03055 [Thermales bacterium]|nr:hypothetical protein [Thermales bacterium]